MPPASAAPSRQDRPAAPGMLRIDVRTHAGGRTTLRASGEVDLATRSHLTDALDAALGRALGTGSPALVIDLRDVTFIDCGGTQTIADTVRTALAHSIDLRVQPGPALDDLVALIGGWNALVIETDGVRVDGRTPSEAQPAAGDPPADPPVVAEYDHLAPLFTERKHLPADHPRRRALRTELITGYLPVAHHIARRHRTRGENLDDLEQVATIGLINAVDRFDVDRGHDFLAFAVPTITGEIQRHYRDRTSTIRIPRRIRQLQSAVHHATDELSRRHGTAPRPSDVSRYLDIDLAAVIEALEANSRTQLASLDEPFPGDETAAENQRYAGALGAPDPDLDLMEDREALGPLLDALPDRDRRILLLRFFGNQTQSQIADQLGISQMHVSRLLTTTLARLRAGMDGTTQHQA
ncbi:SigB/SigF/SigG family RNA polymerase sigma factor [Pseudonocardia humida]|uniref:SigB/SigF/SigG family RNA polymerase sigma factor n=1 Tax=Pseudonocardia humida TaxID=2800819 RepID=A0ABT0ZVD6_9PSEU|nr:SigB/SigF/SigG family RNA polymerase sigma factor [Pseudonocardia humida]MCO1654618.1 SigB/SigF/SigG family RNA polymerase sigma factor [Pseudonocardia humida]